MFISPERSQIRGLTAFENSQLLKPHFLISKLYCLELDTPHQVATPVARGTELLVSESLNPLSSKFRGWLHVPTNYPYDTPHPYVCI